MGKTARSSGVRSRQNGAGGYLTLIDGLRGIAAIGILFYHYVHFFMAGHSRGAPEGVSHQFPFYEHFALLYDRGYLAVQIFWLISGFVFSHVYSGKPAGTRSFVVNRFARLYPLHLVTLLVVTVLQAIALARLGYTPIYGKFDLEHFVPQLFMASNWLREAGGYSFNGPIWSVSVEIVVYALFWLSRGIVARFGLPLVAALVVGFYFLHQHYGEYTRVFMCAFYFFTGCGFNLIRQTKEGGRGLQLAVIGLAGAVGLVGAFEGSDWGWRYIAIPGFGGAAFLILAASEGLAPKPLRSVCQWLGENAYGTYLWHFPIQLCLILILAPSIDPQIAARHGWFLVLYLVLVVSLARFSFVSFERPIRDALRRGLGSPRQAGRLGAP